MKINIYELIEGAKQAKGLTVIIDVFRAFSLECYLFSAGAEKIYPVGDMKEAFAFHDEHPNYVLIGERGGAKVDGCDFGNSPSQTAGFDFHGRRVIHSTSAGTQGIVNASGADEIITASLVNAAAVAEYIRRKKPETVSIVAMGNAGIRTVPEDVLCAEYIRALLLNEQDTPTSQPQNITDQNMLTASLQERAEQNELIANIQEKADQLRHHGGEHFFDPARQHIYPQEDFYLCTRCNRFTFVIRAGVDGGRLVMTPVSID